MIGEEVRISVVGEEVRKSVFGDEVKTLKRTRYGRVFSVKV